MALTAIVEQLQHLGMSGYEAKAYVALVAQAFPSMDTEVAKKSGVPRSTVSRDAQQNSVARGAAFEVKASGDGSAVEYLPLPPRVLVSRLSKEYEESIAELERILPTVTATPQVRLIHDLGDKTALLDCARDVVNGSKHELFISAWGSNGMSSPIRLLTADRRSVDISALTFGRSVPRWAIATGTHAHPEVSLANLGCRMFTVVGDRERPWSVVWTDINAWGAPPTIRRSYCSRSNTSVDIAIQLMGEHFDAAESTGSGSPTPTSNVCVPITVSPPN